MSHLAHDVIQNAFDGIACQLLFAYLEVVQIKSCEQGIVIEHLFKVRYEPFGISGVTMKTAAELIVHAAVRHLVAGVADDFERFTITRARMSAQQEFEGHGRRKLGSAAEAAVYRIVTSHHADVSSIE